MQRKLERTKKLLNLDPDCKKAEEKIVCDETRNTIENKNDFSDSNGSLSMRRNLSPYSKGNSNEIDTSNRDTTKTVGAPPSSRKDRNDEIEATKVNIEIFIMMAKILAIFL